MNSWQTSTSPQSTVQCLINFRKILRMSRRNREEKGTGRYVRIMLESIFISRRLMTAFQDIVVSCAELLRSQDRHLTAEQKGKT